MSLGLLETPTREGGSHCPDVVRFERELKKSGWRLGRVRDGRLDSCRPVRLAARMLYALVAIDCNYIVELFATRAGAEQARRKVLAEEPNFAEIMAVIEFGELPQLGYCSN